MRGYTLIHRLMVCFLLCTFLFSILIGTYGTVRAATGRQVHSFSVHPQYLYAGQATDKQFACQSNNATPLCYGPRQIQTAYSIYPLLRHGITGKGSTIVIVDAYQAPFIKNDLALFNQTFGLVDSTLNIVAPDGLTAFDANDASQVAWSAEISLDVEWAHAVAPDATIDLVLAKSNQDADIASVFNYAVNNNLGDVISMSFGEMESCADPVAAKAFHQGMYRATRKGITLLASSGDQGAAQATCDNTTFAQGTSFPATDPFVTAVGGTQLQADAITGDYKCEVAWNEPDYQVASGGGFSKIHRKPFYQYNIPAIGKFRGSPDVSYGAALNGGVLTVWGEGPHGPGTLYIFGGTSAGSPQWAGIVALGMQSAQQRLGFINLAIYAISHNQEQYQRTFRDITQGTNTVTLSDINGNAVTVNGYNAAPGWDATTGLGSPIVSKLVPQLVSFIATHDAAKHSDQVALLQSYS